MTRKHRTIVKFISLLLSFTFLLSEISYAAPVNVAVTPSLDPLLLISQDPTRFEAPVAFTTLKEIHKGNGNTFIIHIQDAHANYSGQTNLANALDEIMTKYRVTLVLVEGGTKDDTLTPLKTIAPPEVWKKVAKKFLIEGKITGDEYLNLISDHPMKIMGIEDKALYMTSLKAYGDLADKREAILNYLKEIQLAVTKLKRKLYPAELLEYEKTADSRLQTADFEKRFRKLVELAGATAVIPSEPYSQIREPRDLAPDSSTASLEKNPATSLGMTNRKVLRFAQDDVLAAFPTLQKLKTIQDVEKTIDFDAANLEQAALIEEIQKREAVEEFKDYLSKLSQMKDQRACQFAYFQNTLNMAERRGISLEKYPDLIAYGEYLRSFQELDLDQVLSEMEKAEDEVYAKKLGVQTTDSRQQTADDRERKTEDRGQEKNVIPSERYSQISARPPSFWRESKDLAPNFSISPPQSMAGPLGMTTRVHDALLIRSIDRYLGLLETAYRIQMSTKEFNLFKANEPDFATVATSAFINRKLAEQGYFQDLVPYKNYLEEGKKALEAFYDSVNQRDMAFIQNTEKILKQENQQVAVLISGGYHTPHLKKLFKEKGYSFAVLTPIITSETNQKKYEKILLEPIKKDRKVVESVQGESKATGRSLSDLEQDLIKLKKQSDQLAAARLPEEISGARLAEVVNDVQKELIAGGENSEAVNIRAAKATLEITTGSRTPAAVESPTEPVNLTKPGGARMAEEVSRVHSFVPDHYLPLEVQVIKEPFRDEPWVSATIRFMRPESTEEPLEFTIFVPGSMDANELLSAAVAVAEAETGLLQEISRSMGAEVTAGDTMERLSGIGQKLTAILRARGIIRPSGASIEGARMAVSAEAVWGTLEEWNRSYVQNGVPFNRHRRVVSPEKDLSLFTLLGKLVGVEVSPEASEAEVGSLLRRLHADGFISSPDIRRLEKIAGRLRAVHALLQSHSIEYRQKHEVDIIEWLQSDPASVLGSSEHPGFITEWSRAMGVDERAFYENGDLLPESLFDPEPFYRVYFDGVFDLDRIFRSVSLQITDLCETMSGERSSVVVTADGSVVEENSPADKGPEDPQRIRFILKTKKSGGYYDPFRGFVRATKEAPVTLIGPEEQPNLTVPQAALAAFRRNPPAVLTMFRLMSERGYHVGPGMLNAASHIPMNLDNLDIQREFLRFLSSNGDASNALYWMFEYGILGKFLPGYRQARDFCIGGIHDYSVAAHSLNLVFFIERLHAAEEAHFEEASAAFEGIRQNPLNLFSMRLAVLCHDLGKRKFSPDYDQHHPGRASREILPSIFDRFEEDPRVFYRVFGEAGGTNALDDAARQARWLALYHQDLSTINQTITHAMHGGGLARTVLAKAQGLLADWNYAVTPPMIDMLYLVALADIHSFGASFEPTFAYLSVLRHDLIAPDAASAARDDAQFIEERKRNFVLYVLKLNVDGSYAVKSFVASQIRQRPEGQPDMFPFLPADFRNNVADRNDRNYWSSLFDEFANLVPVGYLERTPDKRLLVELLALAYLKERPEADVVVSSDRMMTETSIGEPLREVLVAASEDRQGLLYKMGGVMAAHGFNILSAEINNVVQGDRQIVFNIIKGSYLDRGARRVEDLEADLAAVLKDEVTLEEIFARPGTPNRFSRAYGGRTEVTFDPQPGVPPGSEHQPATVMYLEAPDRLGLIYIVGRLLAERFEVNIITAPIRTTAFGALDVFYLEKNGQPLPRELQTAIRKFLENVLGHHVITENQLSAWTRSHGAWMAQTPEEIFVGKDHYLRWFLFKWKGLIVEGSLLLHGHRILKRAIQQAEALQSRARFKTWGYRSNPKSARINSVVDKIRRGDPVAFYTVCSMNKNRSVIMQARLEAAARKFRKPVTVGSGGVFAEGPFHSTAGQLNRGIESTALSLKELREADLIIVAGRRHKDEILYRLKQLEKRFPESARDEVLSGIEGIEEKIVMPGDLDPILLLFRNELPDPQWRSGEYTRDFETLIERTIVARFFPEDTPMGAEIAGARMAAQEVIPWERFAEDTPEARVAFLTTKGKFEFEGKTYELPGFDYVRIRTDEGLFDTMMRSHVETFARKWIFMTAQEKIEWEGVDYDCLSVPPDIIRRNPRFFSSQSIQHVSLVWKYLTTEGETEVDGDTFTNLNCTEKKIREQFIIVASGVRSLDLKWRYLTTREEIHTEDGRVFRGLGLSSEKVRKFPNLLTSDPGTIQERWDVLADLFGIAPDEMDKHPAHMYPALLTASARTLRDKWEFLTRRDGETEFEGRTYRNLGLTLDAEDPGAIVRQKPNLLLLGFENLSDTYEFLHGQLGIAHEAIVRNAYGFLAAALDVGAAPTTGLRMRAAFLRTYQQNRGSVGSRPTTLITLQKGSSAADLLRKDIEDFNMGYWLGRERALTDVERHVRAQIDKETQAEAEGLLASFEAGRVRGTIKNVAQRIKRLEERGEEKKKSLALQFRQLRILSDDYLFHAPSERRAPQEIETRNKINHIFQLVSSLMNSDDYEALKRACLTTPGEAMRTRMITLGTEAQPQAGRPNYESRPFRVTLGGVRVSLWVNWYSFPNLEIDKTDLAHGVVRMRIKSRPEAGSIEIVKAEGRITFSVVEAGERTQFYEKEVTERGQGVTVNLEHSEEGKRFLDLACGIEGEGSVRAGRIAEFLKDIAEAHPVMIKRVDAEDLRISAGPMLVSFPGAISDKSIDLVVIKDRGHGPRYFMIQDVVDPSNRIVIEVRGESIFILGDEEEEYKKSDYGPKGFSLTRSAVARKFFRNAARRLSLIPVSRLNRDGMSQSATEFGRRGGNGFTISFSANREEVRSENYYWLKVEDLTASTLSGGQMGHPRAPWVSEIDSESEEGRTYPIMLVEMNPAKQPVTVPAMDEIQNSDGRFVAISEHAWPGAGVPGWLGYDFGGQFAYYRLIGKSFDESAGESYAVFQKISERDRLTKIDVGQTSAGTSIFTIEGVDTDPQTPIVFENVSTLHLSVLATILGDRGFSISGGVKNLMISGDQMARTLRASLPEKWEWKDVDGQRRLVASGKIVVEWSHGDWQKRIEEYARESGLSAVAAGARLAKRISQTEEAVVYSRAVEIGESIASKYLDESLYQHANAVYHLLKVWAGDHAAALLAAAWIYQIPRPSFSIFGTNRETVKETLDGYRQLSEISYLPDVVDGKLADRRFVEGMMTAILQRADSADSLRLFFADKIRELMESRPGTNDALADYTEAVLAPTADYLGQQEIADLMRDQVLRYRNPAEYRERAGEYREALGMDPESAHVYLRKVLKRVISHLHQSGVDMKDIQIIRTRVKSVTSSHIKLQKGEDLQDLFGIMIVLRPGPYRSEAFRDSESQEAVFTLQEIMHSIDGRMRGVSGLQVKTQQPPKIPYFGYQIYFNEGMRDRPIQILLLDSENYDRYSRVNPHWIYEARKRPFSANQTFESLPLISLAGNLMIDLRTVLEGLQDRMVVFVRESQGEKAWVRPIFLPSGAKPADVAGHSDVDLLKLGYGGTLRTENGRETLLRETEILRSGDTLRFQEAPARASRVRMDNIHRPSLATPRAKTMLALRESDQRARDKLVAEARQGIAELIPIDLGSARLWQNAENNFIRDLAAELGFKEANGVYYAFALGILERGEIWRRAVEAGERIVVDRLARFMPEERRVIVLESLFGTLTEAPISSLPALYAAVAFSVVSVNKIGTQLSSAARLQVKIIVRPEASTIAELYISGTHDRPGIFLALSRIINSVSLRIDGLRSDKTTGREGTEAWLQVSGEGMDEQSFRAALEEAGRQVRSLPDVPMPTGSWSKLLRTSIRFPGRRDPNLLEIQVSMNDFGASMPAVFERLRELNPYINILSIETKRQEHSMTVDLTVRVPEVKLREPVIESIRQVAGISNVTVRGARLAEDRSRTSASIDTAVVISDIHQALSALEAISEYREALKQADSYPSLQNNGFKYIGHGAYYVAFSSAKYPDVVFKILKNQNSAYVYYEAACQLEFIKTHVKERVQPVLVDGFELTKIPGVAPYAFLGNEVIVMQNVNVRFKGIPEDELAKLTKDREAGLRDLGIVWSDHTRGDYGFDDSRQLLVTDTGDSRFRLSDRWVNELMSQNSALGRIPPVSVEEIGKLGSILSDNLGVPESFRSFRNIKMPAAAYYSALQQGKTSHEAMTYALSVRQFLKDRLNASDEGARLAEEPERLVSEIPLGVVTLQGKDEEGRILPVDFIGVEKTFNTGRRRLELWGKEQNFGDRHTTPALFVYAWPQGPEGVLALREVNIIHSYRRQNLLRPLLKLFFERFPQATRTHALTRNLVVLDILHREFGFEPPQDVMPNAYKVNTGWGSEFQMNKATRELFLRTASVDEAVNFKVVIATNETLERLSRDSAALPLYIGEVLSRRSPSAHPGARLVNPFRDLTLQDLSDLNREEGGFGMLRNSEGHIRHPDGYVARTMPSPEVIGPRLEALIQWLNDGSSIGEDPVRRAAEAHFRLTYLIHPFPDGNGHVARRLMNMILSSEGFPEFSVESPEEKERYYNAFGGRDDAEALENFVAYVRERIGQKKSSEGASGAAGARLAAPQRIFVESDQPEALHTEVVGEKAALLAGFRNFLRDRDLEYRGIPAWKLIPKFVVIPKDQAEILGKEGDEVSAETVESLRFAVDQLEEEGRVFGDAENPSLLSVRAAPESVTPGMFLTVLNVGINDQTVEGLSHQFQQTGITHDAAEEYAYGLYSKLVEDFLAEVHLRSRAWIQSVLTHRYHVASTTSAKERIAALKKLYHDFTGADFPQDVYDQLWMVIQMVPKRSRTIAEETVHNYHSIMLERMVFGGVGGETFSGAGELVSRDAMTGTKSTDEVIFGNLEEREQGDTTKGLNQALGHEFPGFVKDPELMPYFAQMLHWGEMYLKDAVRLELTVENGVPYLLQIRHMEAIDAIESTVIMDLLSEGVISEGDAFERGLRVQRRNLTHQQRLEVNNDMVPLGKGLVISAGAASAPFVMTNSSAESATFGDTDFIIFKREIRAEVAGHLRAPEGTESRARAVGAIAKKQLGAHMESLTRGNQIPGIVGVQLRPDIERAEFDNPAGEIRVIRRDGSPPLVLKELRPRAEEPDYISMGEDGTVYAGRGTVITEPRPEGLSIKQVMFLAFMIQKRGGTPKVKLKVNGYGGILGRGTRDDVWSYNRFLDNRDNINNPEYHASGMTVPLYGPIVDVVDSTAEEAVQEVVETRKISDAVIRTAAEEVIHARNLEEFTYKLWRNYGSLDRLDHARRVTGDLHGFIYFIPNNVQYTNRDDANTAYLLQILDSAEDRFARSVYQWVERHKNAQFMFKPAVINRIGRERAKRFFGRFVKYARDESAMGYAAVDFMLIQILSAVIRQDRSFAEEILADLQAVEVIERRGAREERFSFAPTDQRAWLIEGLKRFYFERKLPQQTGNLTDFPSEQEITSFIEDIEHIDSGARLADTSSTPSYGGSASGGKSFVAMPAGRQGDRTVDSRQEIAGMTDEDDSIRFQEFFGDRLSQVNLLSPAQAGEDVGSLTLVARSLIARQNIGDVTAFQFEAGNALMKARVTRRDESGKIIAGEVEIYRLNEVGVAVSVGKLPIEKAIFDNAYSIESGPEASASKAETVLSENTAVLEALADILSKFRLGRIVYGNASKTSRISNEAVILTIPVEDESGNPLSAGEAEFIMTSRNVTRSFLGDNVYIEFVDQNGDPAKGFSSDEIPVLKEGQFKRVYIADISRAHLTLASNQGAGFLPVERSVSRDGERAVIPYPSVFVAAVLAVRTKDSSNELLVQIVKTLTGNAFVNGETVRYIHVTPSVITDGIISIYRTLEVKAVQKLNLDQILDLQNLMLQAIGAAA